MASTDTRHLYPAYPRAFLSIFRRNKNITVDKMATILNISKHYYYSIESGTRGHNINASLILRIIEILEVDALEFLRAEARYQVERAEFIELKKKN